MTRQQSKKPMPSWYPHFRMAGRAALLLLSMVSAAWVLTQLTFAILSPFVTYHHEAMSLAKVKRQVTEKQQEKTRLEWRNAWLKSPLGAVEESRRKGMVKEGEHAVTFQFIPPPPLQEAPSATVSAPLLPGHLLWPAMVLLALSFLAGSGWLIRRHRLAQLRRPAGTLTPRSELQRRASRTRK